MMNAALNFLAPEHKKEELQYYGMEEVMYDTTGKVGFKAIGHTQTCKVEKHHVHNTVLCVACKDKLPTFIQWLSRWFFDERNSRPGIR